MCSELIYLEPYYGELHLHNGESGSSHLNRVITNAYIINKQL